MNQNHTHFKQTEIGMIPEDWEVRKLETVIDKIIDYRGKTPKKSKYGIITLSAKSIKNGRIDYNKTYYISEKTFKQWETRGKPKKGDVLLTTEAPLGEVAQLDKEGIAISQRLLAIRAKENELINSYLKYFFMSPIGQNQLYSKSTGTTVQGIKQRELRKIKIPIPPLEEQRAIAKILSDLDEKIEHNQRMNQTLEEIARTIFKHWFVDFEFPNEDGKPYKSSGGEMEYNEELGKFIPKGWKVGRLGEVAEVRWGDTNITKKSYKKIGYIAYSASGPDGFIEKYDYDKIGVVVSAIGEYCGKTWLAMGKWSCIKNTICIFGNYISIYYIYFLTKNKNFWHIRGGAQPFIIKNDILKNKIIIPDFNLTKKFDKIVMDIFKLINLRNKQSHTLAQIRDTLLPKLMSGKIRVPINKDFNDKIKT